jgi:regulatory protein
MPQITDIRPQKRKARFNIYLDGKFGFALPAEVLTKAGLKIDQQISQEKIENLIKENEFAKVYDHVLKFLSFRPRSEKELLDWFKKKQVGEETKKIVWKKLQNLNYVNDEEFAKWWVEQRTVFKPMGKYLIARELKQKGISKEIIEHGTLNMEHKTNELDLAQKAAEKKVKLWKNLPPDKFRQKLSAFLARRGFSWEIINDILSDQRPRRNNI